MVNNNKPFLYEPEIPEHHRRTINRFSVGVWEKIKRSDRTLVYNPSTIYKEGEIENLINQAFNPKYKQ